MKEQVNRIYEFEKFRADVFEGRLFCGGEIISLTPKAFDMLIVLIRNKGKVVSKDALLDEVWINTFVEEGILAQNILTLRKALGTMKDGKSFIETVPRRGYKFVPDVREITGEEIAAATAAAADGGCFENPLYADIACEQKEDENIKTQIIEKPPDKLDLKPAAGNLRRRRFLIGASALVAGFLLIGGWTGWSYLRPVARFAAESENTQIIKLTTKGNIHRFAVSPDGKYLAFVEKRGEKQALLLRQFANENAVEIVPPQDHWFLGLTFSPDSDYIYYVTYDRASPAEALAKGILYRVPILGGMIERISEDLDSSIAISPDKRQIAFIRNYPKERASALIVAGIDGKDERRLSVRPFDEGFSSSGLTWSPDSKIIISPVHYQTPTELLTKAVAVDTGSGEQTSLTQEKYKWVGQSAWLKDGSGILFPALENQLQSLWLLSYPDGNLRPVRKGISLYGVTVIPDSKSIIAVNANLMASFWVGSIENPEKMSKITEWFSERNQFERGVDWTPDGKVVFSSAKNGNVDISIMDADGSNLKPLTSDNYEDFAPVVSPDGRFIVFISNRSGRPNIWRISIDGSNPQQLTDVFNASSPSLSPNSKWLYYSAATGDDRLPVTWKIPVDGGTAVKVSSVKTLKPKISPNGKFIACYTPGLPAEQAADEELALTILSAEDGKIVRQFAERNTTESLVPVFWTSDSQTLLFVKATEGYSNLWRQSIGEKAAHPVTNSNDRIFRFAVSRNGSKLILEKTTSINDIVLLQGFL